MFIDLVNTTREWLLRHDGHMVKQYYKDSIGETIVYLRCDTCDSIKEKDKIIYTEDRK